MDAKKTELFRRLVSDNVKHYLCEVIINTPELTGAEYATRIGQVKDLLTPEDWDDIVINRSSNGYCGWVACSTCAPDKRSLSFLRLMLEDEYDRDVLDSFHSIDCFNGYRLVRSQLDTTLSQLRNVDKGLKEEFLRSKNSFMANIIRDKINRDDTTPLVVEIEKPGSKSDACQGSRNASCGKTTTTTSETGDVPEASAVAAKMTDVVATCNVPASIGQGDGPNPMKPALSSGGASKTKYRARKSVSFNLDKPPVSDKRALGVASHTPSRSKKGEGETSDSIAEWKSISKKQALMMSFLDSADVEFYQYEAEERLRCFGGMEELYEFPETEEELNQLIANEGDDDEDDDDD